MARDTLRATRRGFLLAAGGVTAVLAGCTGNILVTVAVAVAAGNGGNFAFGPSAVAVSPGTTARWVWTGEGGAHNVRALPDEQLGKSDYEFSSGEPRGGERTTFERTLDDPGVALYHCEPHLPLGMKGAVVVTS